MERLPAVVVLGLLVGGCVAASALQSPALAPARSLGYWRLEPHVDRITGEHKVFAKLITFQARQVSRRRSTAAQLLLSCHQGKPFAAFAFAGIVSSRKTATLSYRIDKNPGRTVTVDAIADRRTVAITNEEDVSEFLEQLGPSSVLYVRVHSPRTGTSEAEFSPAGAPAAIEEVRDSCGMRLTTSADARGRKK
jgi:hypothetical protein